jgi:hypothetical protein
VSKVHRKAIQNPVAADLPFPTACKLYAKAWKKKHGYKIPVPEISHALSEYKLNRWILVSRETGEALADVSEKEALLRERAA